MNARVYIIFTLFCCCFSLLGVQKGSVTAVSIEPFFTFPAADSDNAMIGFGWFKNGFALEDALTSCTFSSVYPVSGTVDLAGGTLYLQRDLTLDNSTLLDGLGTIIGNGYTIDFCESITCIPQNLQLISDLNIVFRHDLDFYSTLTVQGNCSVVSSGYVLALYGDAKVIIDTNSSLSLQGFLFNMQNDNVFCVDDTGHLTLDDMSICLMVDMRFTHGDILFKNHVSLNGDATFWYDSNMTCTLFRKAQVSLDYGVNFKLGRKTLGGPDPIYFYNDRSVVSCGECTLTTTGYGLNLCRGRIELLKTVIIDTPLTTTDCGFIMGDGVNDEENFEIYLGPGSMTTFRTGWLVYNNTNGEKFYASAPSARFLRKLNSKFHMATTCTFPQCTLEFEFNGMAVPQTTMSPTAKLYYNGTRLYIPGIGDATFKARREGVYSYVLDTYGSMYFANGIFPGSIQIIGQGNQLIGNGAFGGVMSFDGPSASLTCSLEGSIRGNIALNGGTLLLANNIYLSKDACFLTTGTVNLDRFLIDFGYKEFTFDVPLNWLSNNGFININSNVSLKSTWTINGICTITGPGNTLSLDEGGAIVIAANSTLMIKGLSLDVIDPGDITCVDDTGVLVLDEVRWIQHGNFRFQTGALKFKNKVLMSGEDLSFAYESAMTSTILGDSKLVLDRSFTFSYAPNSTSKTLIQFEDETSTLKLNGATLYMTTTGMHLTKGALQIRQDSTIFGETAFDGEGNLINEGLTLGDGTADNDLYLSFMGDKTLNVYGALNYRNSRQDYLKMCMFSNFNIGTDSILRVYENMNLGFGSITFNSGSTYAYAVDKQLIGSVNAAGEFAITTL